MASNPTLNTCFVPKPFIPARTFGRRHTKRQCCEVPSAASPSRSQFFQSSQFNKAVKSTSYRNMEGAAGRQLHPTDLEECLQPFVTPESQWWDWKYNSRIHYRQQGSSGPCILLVHGFGVGSFHFEQLIQKLSSAYQVWAVDLLGQGMSWPAVAPAPGEPWLNVLSWHTHKHDLTHCTSSQAHSQLSLKTSDAALLGVICMHMMLAAILCRKHMCKMECQVKASVHNCILHIAAPIQTSKPMSVSMCACRGTAAVLHRDLDRSAAGLCDTGHTAACVPCWQLLGGLAFSPPGCYTSTSVQVCICSLCPPTGT